jgi:hypothetical protein
MNWIITEQQAHRFVLCATDNTKVWHKKISWVISLEFTFPTLVLLKKAASKYLHIYDLDLITVEGGWSPELAVKFISVNCHWFSPAQSFLVSDPVGTNCQTFSFQNRLCVRKWGNSASETETKSPSPLPVSYWDVRSIGWLSHTKLLN